MRGRPFTISIDEFLQTGSFGVVIPGMTEAEIKKIFPKPDSVNPMGDGMCIWLYDRMEFHFFEGELFLIWCDWLDRLRNPKKKQFKLNRGFLNKSLTIVNVTDTLKSWGKDYETIGYYSSHNELTSIIYTLDRIVLYFEGSDDIPVQKWELIAIGSENTTYHPRQKQSSYRTLDLDF